MPSIFLNHPRLVLSLIAAIALLPGIFELPLMDRDEPRFSHATIEMMDRDEWVVPYFNGEYRFDKPPLTYWWMRVHYLIFGKSEFAARFHSVMSAWLSALVIFQMACRMGLSRGKSLLAGAIWLTSLQVLIHGRMAVADMPLILFLIITQWAQWEMLRTKERFFTGWFWLYHVAVGVGFLAKGPLAHLIPLLTLLIYAALTFFQKKGGEKNAALKQVGRTFLQALAGIPLSLGIVALWGVPAMIQTDYQYFDIGIGTHVVERGTGAMNGREIIPGIYFLYMLPFLLPWSAQISRVFANGFRGGESDLIPYLFAWFLAPFLIFSFYATQLPHYILPGYPAFTVMMALLIGQPFRRSIFGKVVLGVTMVTVCALCLGMFCAFFLTPSGGELGDLRILFLSLAGLFLFLSISGFFFANQRLVATFLCVFGAAVMMAPVGHYARNTHAIIRMMPYLSDSRETSRAAWGYQEGSLTWYPSDTWLLGHPDRIEGFAEADEMVFQSLRWRVDDEFMSALLKGEVPPPTDDRRAEVDAFIEQFGAKVSGTIRGLNPATSSWVELVIAHKNSKQ